MGRVRDCRVCGAGILGRFERVDSLFCREPGAPGAADRDAGIGGYSDSGFVPGGGLGCWAQGVWWGRGKRDRRECPSHFAATETGDRQERLSYSGAEILAFLAALVSAFVFLVLL